MSMNRGFPRRVLLHFGGQRLHEKDCAGQSVCELGRGWNEWRKIGEGVSLYTLVYKSLFCGMPWKGLVM